MIGLGYLTLEAQSTHQHRYAKRCFVYQGQRHCTIEPLAHLLPNWTSSSVVANTYSLNLTLVEHLQVLGQPLRTARKAIQATTRAYQCLAFRLAQEQARLEKQSRWFSYTQHAYLLAWKRELEAAARRVTEALTELQTAACELSREQPVPLEIRLFNTQTLREPTMLELPLELNPYAPNQGHFWRWWFTLRGYYTFLSAKQDLLTSLHLYFDSPDTDLAQLAVAEQRLRDELEATNLRLDQARFYQLIWQGFLSAWQKSLTSALVRLSEGKAAWHARNNARLKSLVEQLTADIELSLTNVNPEQYEYWTDENIRQAQQKLTELTTILNSQRDSIEKTCGSLDIQNHTGKALYGKVAELQTKLEQRQQGFQDLQHLQEKKAQLGQLPPYSTEIPAINIEDFDNDTFIKQLRAWEASAKAAEAELETPDALGFHQQRYLDKWRGYLLEFSKNILYVKKNILLSIYSRLDAAESLSNDSAEQLQKFLDEFMKSANSVDISENATLILQWLQQSLNDIRKNVTGDNAIASLSQQEKIDKAMQILSGLETGEQYCDPKLIRWLRQFIYPIQSNLNHQLTIGSPYDAASKELNALLLTAIPVAERICEQRFSSLGENKPCLDKDYLEEVLCFGLLLSLGNEHVKQRQQARLNAYLSHQLKYFTANDNLSVEAADDLSVFETILLELCPEHTIKVKRLQNQREKQDWSGYKADCQTWLALITQPPVTALNGLGMLSSLAQPLAPVNDDIPTASTS